LLFNFLNWVAVHEGFWMKRFSIQLLIGSALLLGLAACQTFETARSSSDSSPEVKPVEAAKPEVTKQPKKPPLPLARNSDQETEPVVEAKPEPEEKVPVADPNALTDQQIDQLLNERRITYERAAKLRYREAVRAGRVKTKADHTYWSMVIEIYRNWDNHYISWEEAERRLQAAQSALRGQ
jgi:type IV secretory pathway VirB10-like protein